MLGCFHQQRERGDSGGGSLALYYQMSPEENSSHRGVVDVSSADHRVLSFKEKPPSGETSSRLASPLFYVLRPEAVALLNSWVETNAATPQLSCVGRVSSRPFVNEAGAPVGQSREATPLRTSERCHPSGQSREAPPRCTSERCHSSAPACSVAGGTRSVQSSAA